MSNTGHYVTPESLIFNAAGNAGDKSHSIIPKGFYMALIRDAFVDLNMSTNFAEQRANYPMPERSLTLSLPADCFSVKNIYMFNGTDCTFDVTKKVYWKRNYYTQGQGYVANDKWNNGRDPIFQTHAESFDNKPAPSINGDRESNLLFYNIEMGNLMLSSSCRAAGSMVHIHYNGTGSDIMDAEIIPIFYKTAIEDFITEAALRFRMANEPTMAKNLAYLQQLYEKRLDKEGFRGSWHKAVSLAKNMNPVQRADLNNYLSRGGWATGR